MARYKSRAKRASECAEGWHEVANKLRDADTQEDGQNALEGLDISELESLKEEMESWRDNIEEKFSQTQKYEEVSEAAETLGNIDLSEFEGKEYDGKDDFEDSHKADADMIDAAAEELESVSFPGMY